MLIVFSHQSGEQELDTVCGFKNLFNGHKSDCGVVNTWRITSIIWWNKFWRWFKFNSDTFFDQVTEDKKECSSISWRALLRPLKYSMKHSLWELLVSQLLKKFPAFYVPPKFHYHVHKSPPFDFILNTWIQSMLWCRVFVRFVWVLSSCLCPGLSSGFFSSGFSTKVPYAFIFLPIWATFPAHVIALDLITWIVFALAHTANNSMTVRCKIFWWSLMSMIVACLLVWLKLSWVLWTGCARRYNKFVWLIPVDNRKWKKVFSWEILLFQDFTICQERPH